MNISASDIKKLREQTGVGIVDCKKALEEAQGDYDKALEIVRKKGAAVAMKKSDRAAHEGVIASYIHSNKQIGVLVELSCETDFVARNEEFQKLADEIALHIAASNPLYISPDQVPADVIEKEKAIFADQMKDEKKPADVMEKILDGKMKKYLSEISLLEQGFVRDDKVTIKQLIEEAIGKLGENIQVTGFSRFEVAGNPNSCSISIEA